MKLLDSVHNEAGTWFLFKGLCNLNVSCGIHYTPIDSGVGCNIIEAYNYAEVGRSVLPFSPITARKGKPCIDCIATLQETLYETHIRPSVIQ